ncbi:hypothetical protein [Gallibacterium sp. ZY190522]
MNDYKPTLQDAKEQIETLLAMVENATEGNYPRWKHTTDGTTHTDTPEQFLEFVHERLIYIDMDIEKVQQQLAVIVTPITPFIAIKE